MEQPRLFAVGCVFLVSLIVGCSTNVQPKMIAWNDGLPVVGPPAEAAPATTSLTSLGLVGIELGQSKGYLRVYTDTKEIVNGSLSYTNVRRSFDLYGPDGKLIQGDVNNQGGGNGEEPVLLTLDPGRYVVASTYSTTYRKVQVEVRAGVTTEVPANTLREASPVFAQ
jgi:hypothetical protein